MQSDSTTLNFFPKRPGVHSMGQKMSLATNYFQLSSVSSQNKSFFKYSVDFDPELPGDSRELKIRIWRGARENIKQIMSHTIFNNTTCYSEANIADPIVIETEHNTQSYRILLKWTNLVENSSIEALSLYKKFFGTLVRRINFTPIRRSFFDPKGAKTVDGVELWPGFNSTINIFPSGVLLNMNIVFKVLRKETALQAITKLKNQHKNPTDFISEAQSMFKNFVVLTRYSNDKTYIVDGIDFDKTPMDTFETKTGPISYMDYYSTKYGRNITDVNQPLLVYVDKKKNQTETKTIYLIPEFCYLTGLTDEMRANFNTMKQMAQITKGNANEKMNECVSKIKTFLNDEKCKQDIATWGLTISDKPVTLTGRKLDAGNILMHKKDNGRFSFSIDQTDDIDRKIQTEMYSQPALKKWLVFSTNKDRETTEMMLSTLKQVQGSFRYQMIEPQCIYVKSTNFKDWEEEISRNIKPDVQAVVLVLPGGKGKGFNYNELKRLLTVKFPLPSQVILTSTINKPKGLRSVINKVLMQICAKVGGEPWAIDKIPFTNAPTMVVGLDMYNKGSKSIIGCCATYNNTFTKYVSICKYGEVGSDLSEKVSECVLEASQKFLAINKVSPKHIIILRDGIAPTQVRSIETEIRAILKVSENIKMTYILVNKKTTIKVFANENNNYANIPPGTLVDDVIVDQEKYDFFLISQKSNQGLSAATQYNVMYDDFNAKVEEIHYFVYKLCYLYYNWTGGIKIPAPCQYAKKLAFLVGDKLSTNKEIIIPGERFNNEIRSLFFL